MTESNSENRREFVRLPKGYSVEINEFKFPITSQERISATCADISTGGVCVESPSRFEPGARLQVRVRIPLLNKFMPGFFKFFENDAEQYINAIAEVAWMENALMGLSFVDLDQDVVRAIQGLIKDAVREAQKKEELADAHKRAQEE